MISAKVLCLCGFPAITAPPAHAEVVPVVDAKVDGATKGGPGWTTPTPGLIRHFYLKPRTQKGSVAVFCCDVLACRTSTIHKFHNYGDSYEEDLKICILKNDLKEIENLVRADLLV